MVLKGLENTAGLNSNRDAKNCGFKHAATGVEKTADLNSNRC